MVISVSNAIRFISLKSIYILVPLLFATIAEEQKKRRITIETACVSVALVIM